MHKWEPNGGAQQWRRVWEKTWWALHFLPRRREQLGGIRGSTVVDSNGRSAKMRGETFNPALVPDQHWPTAELERTGHLIELGRARNSTASDVDNGGAVLDTGRTRPGMGRRAGWEARPLDNRVARLGGARKSLTFPWCCNTDFVL